MRTFTENYLQAWGESLHFRDPKFIESVSCDGENSFLSLIGKLSQSASVFRRGDNWFSLHPKKENVWTLFTGISLVSSLSPWTAFRSHPEQRAQENLFLLLYLHNRAFPAAHNAPPAFPFSLANLQTQTESLCGKFFRFNVGSFHWSASMRGANVVDAISSRSRLPPRAPLLIGKFIRSRAYRRI